jgi:hypothetical protein
MCQPARPGDRARTSDHIDPGVDSPAADLLTDDEHAVSQPGQLTRQFPDISFHPPDGAVSFDNLDNGHRLLIGPNRMLKKAASFVLAALGGSTYRKEYAFASSLAAAALDGLFDHPAEMFCDHSGYSQSEFPS